MRRPNGPGPVMAGLALGALALVALTAWSLNRGGHETSRSARVQTSSTPAPTAPLAHSRAAVPASRPVTGSLKTSAPRAPRPAPAVASIPTAAPATAAAPGTAGMVVGIDPETGTIGMPSADQLKRLQPLGVSSLNHSDEGLTPFPGPGRSVGVDLQGRFQEYYVVTVGPDGRRTVTCSSDPTAVKNALAKPPGGGKTAAAPPATPRFEEQ